MNTGIALKVDPRFSEYEEEKFAFSCLLQAGMRIFFTLYSQNLGSSF